MANNETARLPENGVIFSDGIEANFLRFSDGVDATVKLAQVMGQLPV